MKTFIVLIIFLNVEMTTGYTSNCAAGEGEGHDSVCVDYVSEGTVGYCGYQLIGPYMYSASAGSSNAGYTLPNPGTTDEERRQACADACLQRATPANYLISDHATFDTLLDTGNARSSGQDVLYGFTVVQPSSSSHQGKCYCEMTPFSGAQACASFDRIGSGSIESFSFSCSSGSYEWDASGGTCAGGPGENIPCIVDVGGVHPSSGGSFRPFEGNGYTTPDATAFTYPTSDEDLVQMCYDWCTQTGGYDGTYYSGNSVPSWVGSGTNAFIVMLTTHTYPGRCYCYELDTSVGTSTAEFYQGYDIDTTSTGCITCPAGEIASGLNCIKYTETTYHGVCIEPDDRASNQATTGPLMYLGIGNDNPGTGVAADEVYECAKACISRQAPVASTQWDKYGTGSTSRKETKYSDLRGFAISTTGNGGTAGRCYCEMTHVDQCNTRSGTDYDVYKFECADEFHFLDDGGGTAPVFAECKKCPAGTGLTNADASPQEECSPPCLNLAYGYYHDSSNLDQQFIRPFLGFSISGDKYADHTGYPGQTPMPSTPGQGGSYTHPRTIDSNVEIIKLCRDYCRGFGSYFDSNFIEYRRTAYENAGTTYDAVDTTSHWTDTSPSGRFDPATDYAMLDAFEVQRSTQSYPGRCYCYVWTTQETIDAGISQFSAHPNYNYYDIDRTNPACVPPRLLDIVATTPKLRCQACSESSDCGTGLACAQPSLVDFAHVRIGDCQGSSHVENGYTQFYKGTFATTLLCADECRNFGWLANGVVQGSEGFHWNTNDQSCYCESLASIPEECGNIGVNTDVNRYDFNRYMEPDYTFAHLYECDSAANADDQLEKTPVTGIQDCANQCRGESWSVAGVFREAKGFIYRSLENDGPACYCEGVHSFPHSDCATKGTNTDWSRYDFKVPYAFMHYGECRGHMIDPDAPHNSENQLLYSGSHSIDDCAAYCKDRTWTNNGVKVALGFVYREASDACYCESMYSSPHPDCQRSTTDATWSRYDFVNYSPVFEFSQNSRCQSERYSIPAGENYTGTETEIALQCSRVCQGMLDDKLAGALGFVIQGSICQCEFIATGSDCLNTPGWNRYDFVTTQGSVYETAGYCNPPGGAGSYAAYTSQTGGTAETYLENCRSACLTHQSRTTHMTFNPTSGACYCMAENTGDKSHTEHPCEVGTAVISPSAGFTSYTFWDGGVIEVTGCENKGVDMRGHGVCQVLCTASTDPAKDGSDGEIYCPSGDVVGFLGQCSCVTSTFTFDDDIRTECNHCPVSHPLLLAPSNSEFYCYTAVEGVSCKMSNSGVEPPIDGVWGTAGSDCVMFQEPLCHSGGVCIDSTTNATVPVGEYRCLCADGYDGESCQNQNCSTGGHQACLNGGTCFEEGVVLAKYGDDDCFCPSGFEGHRCEQAAANTPCPSSNYKGSQYSQQLLTSGTSEACISANYDGTQRPYGNAADHPAWATTDDLKTLACFRACLGWPGYSQTDPNFQDTLDTDYWSNYQWSDATSFSIRRTADAFNGRCYCYATPLPVNGVCSTGVYTLKTSTYYGYNIDHECEAIDTCTPDPCGGATCLDGLNTPDCDDCAHNGGAGECLNGGTCTDGQGTFTCTCPPGYDGEICQNELCGTGGHQECLNGGTCFDDANVLAKYGEDDCFCPSGFEGHRCERNSSDTPCGADDYRGSTYGKTSAINNGACNKNWEPGETTNGYSYNNQVSQVRPYMGVADFPSWATTTDLRVLAAFRACIQFDGNPTLGSPDFYNNHAVWSDSGREWWTFKSFSYNVNTGKTYCWDVAPVDGECEDGYTFVSAGTGYENYIIDHHCVSGVDTCTPDPCSGETCLDGFNTPDCDDCGHNNGTGDCINGASCTDGQGTFTCNCVHQFSGLLCDECGPGLGYNFSKGYHECEICPVGWVNNQTSHRAGCAPLACDYGFGYTSDIETPEFNYTYDASNTSLDSGNCKRCPPGTESPDGDGQCVLCTPGYEGLDCLVDTDECNGGSGNCLNGATCFDSNNYSFIPVLEYICNCTDGFKGTDCEIDIDECHETTATFPQLCNETGLDVCSEGRNSRNCTCKPGYEGSLCEIDIDECTSTNNVNFPQLCYENGTDFCNTTFGPNTRNCVCIPGYEGARCQNDTNECNPDPCVSGDCTETSDGITFALNTYHCKCRNGWIGTNCETFQKKLTLTAPAANLANWVYLVQGVLVVGFLAFGVSNLTTKQKLDRFVYGKPTGGQGLCEKFWAGVGRTRRDKRYEV